MKDNLIESALASLYNVRRGLIISGAFWDGDSCNMIFENLPDRNMRISSDETFEAFTETVFIECLEEYDEYIKKINARYGTEWDSERRQLYIKFRRNDMTIGEAVTKLHGAMMLIGALSWYVYV